MISWTAFTHVGYYAALH